MGKSQVSAEPESVHDAALQEVISLGPSVQQVKESLERTLREEQEIRASIATALGIGAPKADSIQDGNGDENAIHKQREMQLNVDEKLREVQESIPYLDQVLRNASTLESDLQKVRLKADTVSRRVRQLDLARTRALKMWNVVRIKSTIKQCIVDAQKALNESDFDAVAENVYKYHQVSGASHELANQNNSDQVNAAIPKDSIMTNIENELRDRVLNQLNLAMEKGNEDEVLRSCVIFGKLGHGKDGVSRFTQFIRDHMKMDAESSIESALSASEQGSSSFDAFPLLGQLISQAQAIMSRYREVIHSNFSSQDTNGGLALLEAVMAESDVHICRILKHFLLSYKMTVRMNASLSTAQSPAHKNSLTPHADRIMGQDGDRTAWLNMSTLEALDDLLFKVAQTMQLVVNFDRYMGYESTLVDGAPPRAAGYMDSLQELAGAFLSLSKAYIADAFSLAESVQAPIAAPSDGLDDRECLMSSLVDDAFSIAKAALERALATGHADTACGAVNLAVALLQDRLLQGLRAQAKGLLPWQPEAPERLQRLRGTAASLVAAPRLGLAKEQSPSERSGVVNSLHEACENTAALEREALAMAEEYMQDDHEKKMLAARCEELAEVRTRFEGQVGRALDKLLTEFRTGLKARATAAVLGPPGEELDWRLSEQQYAEQQSSREQAVSEQVGAWVARALAELAPGAVEPVGRKLVERVAAHTAEALEECVLGVKGKVSVLGALLLDQQVRVVTDLVLDAGVRHSAGASIRQSFARLSHMLLVLGLARPEEAYELQEALRSAKLAAADVKRILLMREEFEASAVERLKL